MLVNLVPKQLLSVAVPAEAANTVENQLAKNPQSSRFTWRIAGFSRSHTARICSDPFVVGGCRWYINDVSCRKWLHFPF